MPLMMTEADRLYILVGLVSGCILISILRSVVLSVLTFEASRKLHDQMFAMVMWAPMQFFERTPVGRVLNRFSRDMGMIDEDLPQTLYLSSYTLIYLLGMLISVCIVNPWLTLVTLPTAFLLLLLQQYSMRASRSLKRIESACHSPVYSQLSSTLQGIFTIRSFKMEDKLMQKFHHYQDRHTSAYYLFQSTSRWLGLMVDLILAVFLTIVLVITMILPNDEVNGILLSTSLVQLVGLFDTLQFAVRQMAELENQMTSAERILEYSRLEQENPGATSIIPPKDWPRRGDVEFKNVCLQYRNTSNPSLTDISFTISDKEKVGIVGRTGAGKSSLFTCLLRLAEPEGHIFIDGVDILEIGLANLRSKISVIPQDPILFSGTIRYNLDPFSVFDDDERHWKALREVQLEEKVKSLGAGLDAIVHDSGSNFSVGERQLICLARAILLKNKILIIDEATAYVDYRTDQLIQNAIREQFQDCTVITIAHRLHTVIDADQILVMENGKVHEFDHPHKLLENEGGLFHQMAQCTGPSQFVTLKEKAREHYEKYHTE